MAGDVDDPSKPKAGLGVDDTHAPDSSSEGLDYSGEETNPTQSIPAPQAVGQYDPRPHEDGARRTIAYILIGLLCGVIAAIFILLSFGSIAVSEIKEFGFILGPVVTLVSAATGFYYGTKSTVPPNT
jgi:hypothetical protein